MKNSLTENDNFDLSAIVSDAPYLMEQTTAYKALENFKKTGFSIILAKYLKLKVYNVYL